MIGALISTAASPSPRRTSITANDRGRAWGKPSQGWESCPPRPRPQPLRETALIVADRFATTHIVGPVRFDNERRRRPSKALHKRRPCAIHAAQLIHEGPVARPPVVRFATVTSSSRVRCGVCSTAGSFGVTGDSIPIAPQDVLIVTSSPKTTIESTGMDAGAGAGAVDCDDDSCLAISGNVIGAANLPARLFAALARMERQPQWSATLLKGHIQWLRDQVRHRVMSRKVSQRLIACTTASTAAQH